MVDQGYDRPQKHHSVSKAPLSIGGQNFQHGLGTHAPGYMAIDLHGAEHFSAMIGVDDGAGAKGTGVLFRVLGEAKPSP